MELNERIRYIRKELKMNRDEFAETLGFSNGGVVSNMELGRAKISDERINLICKVHNINKDWLLTGEGEPFGPIRKKDELAKFVGKILRDEEPTFVNRFVEMLAALEPEDWKVLEKAVEILKRVD